MRVQILHEFADCLVSEWRLPATEAEVAAGIFCRRTGTLNDAIQADVFDDDELAHELPCSDPDSTRSLARSSGNLDDRSLARQKTPLTALEQVDISEASVEHPVTEPLTELAP